MTKVLVMGIDPGFANIGYTFALADSVKLHPIRMGVIRTVKGIGSKTNSDDNFRRALEICKHLMSLVAEMEDKYGSLKLICTEAKSFPRNASSSAKISMFLGVLSMFSYIREVNVIQIAPIWIKRALCKKNITSKKAVQDGCISLFGKKVLDPLVEGLSKDNKCHCYDALAVLVTCFDSNIKKVVKVQESKG